MKNYRLAFAFLISAACLPTAVSAQTPAPPAGTDSSKKSDDPAKSGDSKNAPLSDKLNESEGVLKPPTGVDPEMNKGAPKATGDKMPVIVPPGEPGGDQSVQPK